MQMKEIENEDDEEKKPGNISFSLQDKLFIEFDEIKGIVLHRENFPEFKPDNFVQEFINIMEEHFNIRFEKKSNSDGFLIKGKK